METQQTIEDIVALIQSGREDHYLRLWSRCKRYVRCKAFDRMNANGYDGSRGYGGVTIDDLMQVGFIAMMQAVKTYKPGGSFLNWLTFYLKREFARAMGYHSSKREPLDSAISVSRPRGEDGTLESYVYELVTEPDCAEIVDAEIYRQELRAALDRALDKIRPSQAEAIRKTFFEGKTLREYGEEIGVCYQRAQQLKSVGLEKLKRDRGLRAFLGEQISYYTPVGVRQFNTTRTSSTELLALRRIDLEKQYMKLMGEIP